MTDADYRDMASEIRDLIPLLMHAQAVADLRLLADRYERRARYLEVVASNHRLPSSQRLRRRLYSQDEMDQRGAT